MTKKGFTIKIEEELWKKFSIKCIKEDTSKSEVIREFIKEYVGGGNNKQG